MFNVSMFLGSLGKLVSAILGKFSSVSMGFWGVRVSVVLGGFSSVSMGFRGVWVSLVVLPWCEPLVVNDFLGSAEVF